MDNLTLLSTQMATTEADGSLLSDFRQAQTCGRTETG